MKEFFKKYGTAFKEFFKKYNYDMVKMLLDQFATGIFGFGLCLTTTYAQKYALRNACSIGAVLFYCFLLYTMVWDLGFKERGSILREAGEIRTSARGLQISLCANIPNYVFALFIFLAKVLDVKFFSTLGGISTFITLIFNGAYMGLLTNKIGETPLNSYVLSYLVITIPALLTSFIAYNMGIRDIKIFKMSISKSEKK